jgi:hypothetical protein
MGLMVLFSFNERLLEVFALTLTFFALFVDGCCAFLGETTLLPESVHLLVMGMAPIRDVVSIVLSAELS